MYVLLSTIENSRNLQNHTTLEREVLRKDGVSFRLGWGRGAEGGGGGGGRKKGEVCPVSDRWVPEGIRSEGRHVGKPILTIRKNN